jgi:hypothetical protein
VSALNLRCSFLIRALVFTDDVLRQTSAGVHGLRGVGNPEGLDSVISGRETSGEREDDGGAKAGSRRGSETTDSGSVMGAASMLGLDNVTEGQAVV